MAQPEVGPPDFRTVTVQAKDAHGREETRHGADLDDILRWVLMDMRRRLELSSDTALAELVGLDQKTLSDWLGRRKPRTDRTTMRLETLSRVCAATKRSPGELFALHPRYAGVPAPSERTDQVAEPTVPYGADEAAPFAVDVVYDQFRSLISVEDARRLLRVILTLRRRSAFGKLLSFVESAVGLDSPLPAAPEPEPSTRVARRRIEKKST